MVTEALIQIKQGTQEILLENELGVAILKRQKINRILSV